MATVTNTDFVRDFSGVGDANPYTITGVTEIDGANIQVVSGAIATINGAGAGDTVEWRTRINGTATATLLRASVEMAGTGSYNVKGPAILSASGEGYLFGVGFNQFARLYRVAANAVQTELGTTNLGSAFAAGSRLHLTLDTATGDLRCYVEGTEVAALADTDTTYNTGMMPGFAMLGFDGGMAGFISAGGDYLSGGGGGSAAAIVAYMNMLRANE